jgi:hypothetical protein
MKVVIFLVEKICHSAVKKTVPSNIVKGEIFNLKRKHPHILRKKVMKWPRFLVDLGRFSFAIFRY